MLERIGGPYLARLILGATDSWPPIHTLAFLPLTPNPDPSAFVYVLFSKFVKVKVNSQHMLITSITHFVTLSSV